MTWLIGLTGSIGMGKSTTAKMFADLGCAVWDADAAVHRVYAVGGPAVAPMAQAFPDAVVDGAVSRDKLKEAIAKDPGAFKVIESIVHPLIGADRQAFIKSSTADIIVLDVPLLFETGGNKRMDTTVCVSAPADIQRQRVMDRGTMTEAQFETILSKQMPDADKRALADYVVTTDTLENAQAQVETIVSKIREKIANA
jgi:dephospho-CoA kinase